MQQKLNCRLVNQLDMVTFLEKLGFKPDKVRGNDHWYLSPLREEKTASFKVNRTKNIWYDHGAGKGGTLVDFAKLYYACTVKGLLEKLNADKGLTVSFPPQHNILACEKKEVLNRTGKIKIISDNEINNQCLKNYLHARKIPLDLARQYCREISFELHDKKHLVIGFQNPGGGYELRNHYFKGSSTPKEPRLIGDLNAKELVVFEGFFSFLSYMALQYIRERNIVEMTKVQAASLVLNSISFFEKNRALMEKYDTVHLCLDQDKMGKGYTQKALQWSSRFKDQSHRYGEHKDLNDYLIKSVNPGLKQSRSNGMKL